MPPQIWENKAACRGAADTFFSDDLEAVAEARRICLGCPVFADCRTAARHHPDGLWAGQTAAQRAASGDYVPAPSYCSFCNEIVADGKSMHRDCRKQFAVDHRKQLRAEVSAGRGCERCGVAIWPQARSCLVCRHIVGQPIPNRPWPGS